MFFQALRFLNFISSLRILFTDLIAFISFTIPIVASCFIVWIGDWRIVVVGRPNTCSQTTLLCFLIWINGWMITVLSRCSTSRVILFYLLISIYE
jgi:hypothetical protein